MTAHTFSISFDGLPLYRNLKMTAAEVSGEAEITVWDEDDWSITGIALDTVVDGKVVPFAEVERGSWLFNTIHSELESNWKDQIEDRLASFIEEFAHA